MENKEIKVVFRNVPKLFGGLLKKNPQIKTRPFIFLSENKWGYLMTNALIAKPKRTSVVVQRLGCLAFTQETRVRFPTTEMFSRLFLFLTMLHYLTKFCITFLYFPLWYFPSYGCSHCYHLPVFDKWN